VGYYYYLSDGLRFKEVRDAAKAEAIAVARAYSSKSGARLEVRQLRPADLDVTVVTNYNAFPTNYTSRLATNSAVVIFGYIDFDPNALSVAISNGTTFIIRQFLLPIFNTLEKQGVSEEFKEWGEFLEQTQPAFVFATPAGFVGTTLNLFPLAYVAAVEGAKIIVIGASSAALPTPPV